MLRTGQEERSVGVSSVAKSMADCAGSASAVIVPVVAGNCSKIRVGGWNPGDEGTVTLTVTAVKVPNGTGHVWTSPSNSATYADLDS